MPTANGSKAIFFELDDTFEISDIYLSPTVEICSPDSMRKVLQSALQCWEAHDLKIFQIYCNKILYKTVPNPWMFNLCQIVT